MPTWREVAEWADKNVHRSSAWDPRDSDPYDAGRDAVIEALADKAAFEERADELRRAGTTLYRTALTVAKWPGRPGSVVLVQFIRDDEIVLFELIDIPPTSDTKARMRMVEAMSKLDAKSQELEDRRHYVEVSADIDIEGESLRRIA